MGRVHVAHFCPFVHSLHHAMLPPIDTTHAPRDHNFDRRLYVADTERLESLPCPSSPFARYPVCSALTNPILEKAARQQNCASLRLMKYAAARFGRPG